VFKINSAGTLSPLHSFSGGSGGDTPNAGLIQAMDGFFYGTTSAGGTNGLGTVFRISSAGSFTNLYLFTGHADGSDPEAGLVQGVDGLFYGTAFSGGASNAGTVFKLSTSNSVSVSASVQITAIQIIGTNVVITIPSLVGSTYQLQYSASMTPTNWLNVSGASAAGTGSSIMLTDVGGALQPQRFYRVDITMGGSTPSTAQINSIQAVGSNMVITMTAIPADTYQLQYSNTISLPTWINVGSPTNGVTGTLQLTDPGGASVPSRFYQVEITP